LAELPILSRIRGGSSAAHVPRCPRCTGQRKLLRLPASLRGPRHVGPLTSRRRAGGWECRPIPVLLEPSSEAEPPVELQAGSLQAAARWMRRRWQPVEVEHWRDKRAWLEKGAGHQCRRAGKLPLDLLQLPLERVDKFPCSGRLELSPAPFITLRITLVHPRLSSSRRVRWPTPINSPV
jgi:hypothetical protein